MVGGRVKAEKLSIHYISKTREKTNEKEGRCTIMNSIFERYNQFYTMLLSTTVMSNVSSMAYQRDMEKVIEYIGRAYRSDEDFITLAKSTILGGKMMGISLLDDRYALNAMGVEQLEYDELDAWQYVLDMKCDAISELHAMAGKKDSMLNEDWFNYSQKIFYQPTARFNKIKASAAPGHVLFTRQTGLLHMLGIGCERDYEKGIHRLSQCVAWGDIPSMYLLAHAYEIVGDRENSDLLYEVASLSEKYLDEGRTIIPKDDECNYSVKARNYFIFIASVKQDVVYGGGVSLIDFAFVEAMQSTNIDNYDRMGYINNYARKEWKELTNTSVRPIKRAGFGHGL